MNDDELSPGQIRKITAYVDIHLPPPDVPVALILFGTNQAQPATIAARRYHLGLAPLIIATGGVNRHNGITEGQVFQDLLTGDGVPGEVIRVEDQSANTWQNVELSGLPLTVVSKWYHRRAVHILRTLLPEAGFFYAIAWEPLYGGKPITRTDWPQVPDGRRRVIREWQEIPRRVADDSFLPVARCDGAWQ